MTLDHTGNYPMRLPAWTIAVAAALLFGVLDVGAALTGGATGIRYHNPMGMLALALTGGFHEAPDPQRVALMFRIVVAGSTALSILCAVLAA